MNIPADRLELANVVHEAGQVAYLTVSPKGERKQG